LIKVALFSDIHVDYTYTEGNNIECGETVCCKVKNGKPTSDANKAGPWGHH